MFIFSFFIFAIIFLVASVLLGIIGAVVAWLLVRKRDWRFKWLVVLMAAITPLLFGCMETALWFVGTAYVSETKGVDWGFGDYWEAPLTQSHYLYAIDMPESAQIVNRDKSKPKLDDGIVQRLWVWEDSIVVVCSKSNYYSLLAFYPLEDSADVLLHHVDSLQLAEALQCRNLDPKSAMIPNDYFCMTQAKAHKVEEPVRHFLSFSFILALWAPLIWFVRKRRKNNAIGQKTDSH